MFRYLPGDVDMDFCPFRACSCGSYAGRIGVHERAESPMVYIAQAGTLGVLMRGVLVYMNGLKARTVHPPYWLF